MLYVCIAHSSSGPDVQIEVLIVIEIAIAQILRYKALLKDIKARAPAANIFPMAYDSTGKTKAKRERARSHLSFVALAMGFCVGFVLIQRGYIEFHRYSYFKQSMAVNESSNIKHSGLLQLLEEVAPTREVLVAVSNIKMMQGEKMLQIWLESVLACGISNFVVASLDRKLAEVLEEKKIPVILHEFDVASSIQGHTGDNHAISAQKYAILLRFLDLGWSVFLCDIDIVILKNPFLFLHRDSDIEAMSDGFDHGTAYGAIYSHDDPTMGWSRYAQGIHHYNLNSGLFWIAANKQTLDLMKRLSIRLLNEIYWDQTAFNEEIFFLSHGSYKSSQVSVRVMDIDLFMNSKYLFKTVRWLPIADQPDPVLVHMNYHPDKQARMLGVVHRYVDGDKSALDSFAGGSEPGS